MVMVTLIHDVFLDGGVVVIVVTDDRQWSRGSDNRVVDLYYDFLSL